MFSKQTLYCNGCGLPYPTNFGGIVESLSHSRVCSMECHAKVLKQYCRCLLDKPEEAQPVSHFVSASCTGEACAHCGRPATHKVGEEIPQDEPLPAVLPEGFPAWLYARHNLTAYVCCELFHKLFGPAAPCFPKVPPAV